MEVVQHLRSLTYTLDVHVTGSAKLTSYNKASLYTKILGELNKNWGLDWGVVCLLAATVGPIVR